MDKCGNPFCLNECDPIQRAYCVNYIENENTIKDALLSINAINAYRCLSDMAKYVNNLEEQISLRYRFNRNL